MDPKTFDNFYQLLPLGEFVNPHEGVTEVVDPRGVMAILEDFQAKSVIPNFPGLLVDFDHQSQAADGGTFAAGWIIDIEATDSGIWGRIVWSDTGAQSVASGQYRFLSAVTAFDELEDGRHRIVSIVGAGLCNEPSAPVEPLIDFTSEEEPESYADVANRSDKLRGDCVLISNSARADYDDRQKNIRAQQLIDQNWTEAGFNNWIELCRLLNLAPENSDENDVKQAQSQMHATRAVPRRRMRNRWTPHPLLPNPNMNNRSIAHEIRKRMNRGSSIRGYENDTTTTYADFAGPVKFTREATVQSKPQAARLNWKKWENGMPNFDSGDDLENEGKLNAMCDRLCKNKSPQGIRILANAYAEGYTRSRLYKLADTKEQSDRVKNRARPLGCSREMLLRNRHSPLGASASLLLNR